VKSPSIVYVCNYQIAVNEALLGVQVVEGGRDGLDDDQDLVGGKRFQAEIGQQHVFKVTKYF
jgi:hypothetical protein